jgi:hypothetical protein
MAGEPIAHNSTTTWRNIFPVGKGAGETWERLRLMFHHTMTAGGAWTNVVESGAYSWIRRITLETSDGETLVDMPGTALHLFNTFNDKHCPWHTPTPLAVNGLVLDAVIDIPFGFQFLRKPEDGYLDSGAYSGLILTITTGIGPVAGAVQCDMGLGNAGANADVVTFDLSVIRTKAGMFNNAVVKPLFVPYLKYIGSRVPSNVSQYFDIESANDLALFGFFLGHGTVARTPFDFITVATGLSAWADTVTSVTFGDNIIPNIVDQKLLASFHLERERDFPAIYPLSAVVAPNIPTIGSIAVPWAGIYHHNFVRDGSVYGAYPCGNKSQIRISYNGGAAGTAEVGAFIYGFRTKRRIF